MGSSCAKLPGACRKTLLIWKKRSGTLDRVSAHLRNIVTVNLVFAGVVIAPALHAASGTVVAPTLHIGDPAPVLQPAKWLKGSPISGFEKGHVYVVEFWATWCGACRAAMPHLSELAKKYDGKAEVIGVDICETSEPAADRLPKVAAFVKSEGTKMAYHVAADGLDNKIAITWIQAAGEGGIPTAFVVGKDGRIAWIGNPSDGLDAALPQIIDNSFDVGAARTHHEEVYGPGNAITAAWNGKNYTRVVDLVNAEIAKDPTNEDEYDVYYLVALAHTDVAQYEKRARAAITRTNGDVNMYQKLCTFLLIDRNLSPEAYRLGLSLVDEALKKNVRRPSFLALGAEMTYNLGDRKGAVQMQAEAVKAEEGDPDATASFLANLRKDLAKYTAEAG